MKVESRSLVDLITEKAECLGACFCSYSWDSTLFENQVLAGILNVQSDPVEMPERFLGEARHRCREIPVVCLVSGQQYMGGQRLPYGVATVSRRVFHPKIYWLLRKEESVVAVGSGNMTERGLGWNAELFVSLRLNYQSPLDRRILFDMKQMLKDLGRSLDRFEFRLEDFIAQLDTLCPNLEKSKASAEVKFLHTEGDSSILDRVFEAVGKAGVKRVSVMAPFFEEDGTHLEGSVLWRMLQKANGATPPEFHIAIPWDGNDTERPEKSQKDLKGCYDQVWCWKEDEDEESFDYWIPLSTKKDRVKYLDARGTSRSRPLSLVKQALEDRRTWPVGSIELFAPGKILDNIEKKGICPRIFLFPERHVENGVIVSRSLHAKCMLITGEKAGQTFTWLFVGSANASRNAMMKKGANVEAGLLWRVPGDIELTCIAKELVYFPTNQVKLVNRKPIAFQENLALMIKTAIYHARTRELFIEWDERLSHDKQVRLSYAGEVIFEGMNPPSRTDKAEFELQKACCELELEVACRTYPVPITIQDPESLPDDPVTKGAVLSELIALYGGRISREKLSVLTARSQSEGSDMLSGQLTALFGRHFQPVDVFRAWFGIKAEMEQAGLSPGGMRVLIGGWRGVKAICELLQDACPNELTFEQSWFYRVELYRTLSLVTFHPTDVFRDKKKGILDKALIEMRGELISTKPGGQKTVEKHLKEFYL